MGYEMLGRLHAGLLRMRDDAGQGTVEYVALILLVAGVLAGVVAAGKGMNGASLAKTIVGKLQDSLESVGKVGK
jgi:hypothetical protein